MRARVHAPDCCLPPRLQGGDSMPAAAVAKPVEMQPSSSVSTSTRVFNVVLPVMVLAAAVAVNYYLAKRA